MLSRQKIAVYPALWSSDIKSNITNEIPDPENCYAWWYIFRFFMLAKFKLKYFIFFCEKLVVYPATWSSDIKSNITIELLDHENC